MSHVMNTYARQPVAFVRGEGVWLWDEAGKQYLDALAGIAVNTLGHAHPRLVRALAEQVGAARSTPPTCYQIPLQEQRGRPLAAITGHGQRVLLQFRAARPTRRRSSSRACTATTAASTSPPSSSWRRPSTAARWPRCRPPAAARCRPGFEPLVQGFVRVPLNDLEAVRQVAAHNRNVVAVLVEPIQGEGGINVVAPGVPARPARDLRPQRAGCSCSTRCRAASGAPASGSSTSTPASCPT